MFVIEHSSTPSKSQTKGGYSLSSTYLRPINPNFAVAKFLLSSDEKMAFLPFFRQG
jgi:hypothetical protein